MQRPRLLDHFIIRNLVGLGALLAVHFITDWNAIDHRPGFSKVSPYLYLLLLYGWIVFHNRILFERLFLHDKKAVYFGWLLVLMVLGSFNMNFVLYTQFDITRSLPFIVNFWVYTVTGLGVYITYRYLSAPTMISQSLPPSAPTIPEETGYFSCMVDGARQTIACADILYVESLENYLKIFTNQKVYVTRLTLKEAEERLPKRQFIRISRSAIINRTHIDRKDADAIWIGTKELRIGKVYKRYVAEQFAGE
ncbi:LytTR family transcriptional regulator [Spirosoma sp. KCTC 42546]|uniref:LytR/AlgR family response regulator transcription factor n=1 Tax=Spirosoma sp. KCTC 42546 TaxID=2520506 RepID=UPI001159D896|nr:LytTR family DNA-binding domain-containing protein [Spirosoma sp. KCTC 42546]QDK79535.1 LytTR family transcriptional regulator [Spirosoma sp. KCTC 42546]